MTNHVHLLVSPQHPNSLAKAIQSTGRRYVAHFNRRYDRTGTLWEGRYRAGIVDSDYYVLACYRYIEMNPVRAGISPTPASFPWSSHLHNAYGMTSDLVIPHPVFLELGDCEEDRGTAYRSMFANPLPEDVLESIRAASRHGWAIGDSSFCKEIEGKTGRRVQPLRRGRRSGKVPGGQGGDPRKK
jgi:putative transposase